MAVGIGTRGGPPFGGVREQRRNLRREVPGQDHDHVGLRLRDTLGWVDRDVSARCEPAVLVGVAVHRVVEEIRSDAAEVEQRVPLAGRAVADDLLAVTTELDQEPDERALGLVHPLGESSVASGPEGPLTPRARGGRQPRRTVWIVLVRCVHAQ